MSSHEHVAVAPRNRQTFYVAVALLLGIVVGELLNGLLGGSNAGEVNPLLNQILSVFSAITDIFLRLVKMIIAPLVIATLVVGMAKMGDPKVVGRIGLKALLWFFRHRC